MLMSDVIGIGGALSFGLWWVVFPQSVIRFYTWFHHGHISIPKATGIRVAGLLWIGLIVVVSVYAFHK
jgi:hypothetical protein